MFLTSLQMQITISDYTFSTPRKGSPFVYVLNGQSFRTLPRVEAESLYRSLRNKGFKPYDKPAHIERNNRGLGNYVTA